MQENPIAAGASLQTPLKELKEPLVSGEGSLLSRPLTPTPIFSISGLEHPSFWPRCTHRVSEYSFLTAHQHIKGLSLIHI